MPGNQCKIMRACNNCQTNHTIINVILKTTKIKKCRKMEIHYNTLLCLFLYLQILAARITFLLATFATFLVVLRHFWQYVEFEDRYLKKPVSVTKNDISDHIYQRIYSSL